MRGDQLKTPNRLINRLARSDQALLWPKFQRIGLMAGQVLHREGKPLEHVYFMEAGLSSTVLSERRLEVALTGFEGFVGIAAALGSDRSPVDTVVKIDGGALRIGTAALRQAMDQSPSLRRLLLRYVDVLTTQMSQAILSYAHFTVRQRLARWILMAQDRLQTAEIPLTHEAVAIALGARRASVTLAFHELEGERMVQAKRGRIRVVDRDGLRAAAGAIYGVAEQAYEALIESASEP
jgi:CRP-like cAMP-binding protein